MREILGQNPLKDLKILFFLVGLSLLGGMSFFQFGSLPGFHADEALSYELGQKILGGEYSSLSGFTNYTGSLYPGLLSQLGKFGHFSLVGSIRIVSLFSLFLMVGLVSFFFSESLLYFFPFFILATPLLWAYSRLGWEVTALQPLFLGISWVGFRKCIQSEKISFWKAFLLGLGIWLGIWNHVIFLTVALSFLLCTLLLVTSQKISILRGLSISLLVLQGVLWFAIKESILEPAAAKWGVQGVIFSSLFLLGLTSIAVSLLSPGKKTSISEESSKILLLLHKNLVRLMLIGILFFFYKLGPSFFGSWTGELVALRWLGKSMPLPLLSYGFLTLIALFALLLYRDSLNSLETLLLATFFSSFCVITTRPQERHEILPVLFFTLWAAVRYPKVHQKFRVGVISLVSIWIGASAFWFITESNPGSPKEFQWAGIKDESSHFLPKEKLVRELMKKGVCKVSGIDPLTSQPIETLLAYERKMRNLEPCSLSEPLWLTKEAGILGYFSFELNVKSETSGERL